MEITVITNNKFENIRSGLMKYGVAYNHEKTQDLSIAFIAAGTRIDEILKMYTGQKYTADEAQARRNGIESNLANLEQELKYHFDETPDEITKQALSDVYQYKDIFK